MAKNRPTRTIAIETDLANELAEEAVIRQKAEGRSVTMRELAEEAIRDLLRQARLGRASTTTKVSDRQS